MKSFHPKLWFVRYKNDSGKSLLKLIVLTRNLTFDQSFDYAVEMTGKIGKRKQDRNAPLKDMLMFTAGHASPQIREKIIDLADDFMRAEKFSLSDRFEDYEFFTLGVKPGIKNETGLFDIYWNPVIFSPFLDSRYLKNICDKTMGEKTLFTRKSSLSQEIIDMFDNVYIIKDVFLDNEVLAEDKTYKRGIDIHAKLYFLQYHQHFPGNYLYVGSANASNKAFDENIEFLLKLKFRKRVMSYRKFVEELHPIEGSPFERIEYIEVSDDPNDSILLDKAIRDAIRNIKGGEVNQDGDTYHVTIHTTGMALTGTAYIAPIFQSGVYQQLEDNVTFDNMQLRELSEFFILKIEDKCVITKIELNNMPEERDQAIYSSIIKNKSGFMAYVSFMLSDNYAESSFEQSEMARKLLDSDNPKPAAIPPALYESMLKCVVSNPRRLLAINNLIEKLDEELRREIEEDFAIMYKPFKEIAEKMIKQ
jgi:hypothetical protein